MPNLTNNGEVLYQDTKDYPAIIFITCMLSLFSVVGTTGNAFVLYVFSNKKDKNTSTVFILALASIDFVTCLVVIPFTIVVEFQYKKIDNDVMCKIYQFFITSNVPFSAFIMVAIAFDRYFCICRPWMKILDIKSAKRIIASLLIFALSLGLITSLAYGVYHRKAKQLDKSEDTDNYNGSVHTNTGTVDASSGYQVQETIVYSESTLDNCSISWKQESNFSQQYNCQLANSNGVHLQPNSTRHEMDFVFTGYCYPTEILISKEFRKIYQTFSASLFLVMFLLVFILYALILRSILNRRSKRLKSSFSGKLLSERKKKQKLSLWARLFTKRSNSPETFNMLPCSSDLNNKRTLERRMTGSNTSLEPTSLATCMTVTAYQLDDETDVLEQTHISHKQRNLSNEVIKEESENSHSAENVSSKINLTPNDLGVPVDNGNSTSRNERVPKVSLKKAGKRDKNVNKTVVMQTDEQGHTTTSHQDGFKVSSFSMFRKDTRKSIKEKHRLANIKTAGILFTVTLVFIIAFLPAWLMATKIIPKPNMIIFYMYFIYNVANPFIYAFFNQTFQQEMKTVLNCK